MVLDSSGREISSNDEIEAYRGKNKVHGVNEQGDLKL